MKIRKMFLVLICFGMVLYAGKGIITNRTTNKSCSMTYGICNPSDIDSMVFK